MNESALLCREHQDQARRASGEVEDPAEHEDVRGEGFRHRDRKAPGLLGQDSDRWARGPVWSGRAVSRHEAQGSYSPTHAPHHAPTSFSYTTGEPAFEAFDYRVAATRSYLEMTRSSFAPSKVAIVGSGRFHLTTGPVYEAGKRYRLTATRNGQEQTLIARADDAGRLSFLLDSGVTSSGQQFRATTLTRQNLVKVEIHPW